LKLARNTRSRNDRVFANKAIRAREVRCLDQDNKNLGVLPLWKAIKIAEDVGLDLVQISASDEITTCKITDYGKYKFDLSKKNKDKARRRRESTIKQKEIKFRPGTDINDLQIKARLASKFISDGCRVKVAIKFKGREVAHKIVAETRFEEFLDFMEVDFYILNEPKMDGKTMVALLAAEKTRTKVKRVS
jgi:translation initiation factor IF-3